MKRGRAVPSGAVRLFKVSGDAGRTSPGDLHGLERRVQEVPRTLEEFGPDFSSRPDPTSQQAGGSCIRDGELGANVGLVSVRAPIACGS